MRFHWSRFLFCRRLRRLSRPGFSNIGIFLVTIVLGIASNALTEQNLVTLGRQRTYEKLTIPVVQVGKQRLAATLSMHPCVPMIAFHDHGEMLGCHDTPTGNRVGIRESGLRIRNDTLFCSHSITSWEFSGTIMVESEIDISTIGMMPSMVTTPRSSMAKSSSVIVTIDTLCCRGSTQIAGSPGFLAARTIRERNFGSVRVLSEGVVIGLSETGFQVNC